MTEAPLNTPKQTLAARFSLQRSELRPYLLQGSAGWHIPPPSRNFSSPGTGLSCSQLPFLYNQPFWLPGLSHLLSFGPPGCCMRFPPQSPPPLPLSSHGSEFCPLWTLPDIPASDCALSHVCSKLSPPPSLGGIMPFPFYSFLFSFLISHSIVESLKYVDAGLRRDMENRRDAEYGGTCLHIQHSGSGDRRIINSRLAWVA